MKKTKFLKLITIFWILYLLFLSPSSPSENSLTILLFFLLLLLPKEKISQTSQGSEELSENFSFDQIDQSHQCKGFLQKLESMVRSNEVETNSLEMLKERMSVVHDNFHEDLSSTIQRTAQMASSSEEMSYVVSGVLEKTEITSKTVENLEKLSSRFTTTIAEISEVSSHSRENSLKSMQISEEIQTKMAELKEAVTQIGDITQTIAEISNKTNLLSLNATIEAARAGEHGKGFAVVASEIKTLAQRTSQATSEIKHKIELIQASTTASVEKVALGRECFASFHKEVFGLDEKIRSQKEFIDELDHGIIQVHQATTEVVSLMREASTAVSNLAKDIGGIHQEIGLLNRFEFLMFSISEDISDTLDRMSAANTDFQARPLALNLCTIKKAHYNWLNRIDNVLSNRARMEENEILPPNACEFGKWFFDFRSHNSGKYKNLDKIQNLHEDIHRLGKEIIVVFNRNGIHATDTLGKNLEKTRIQLFKALHELHNEVEKSFYA